MYLIYKQFIVIFYYERRIEMINVGFIGAGNMGFAIMKGVSQSDLCNDVTMYATSPSIKLYAFDKDDEKIKRLIEYGVTLCTSEADVVEKCKYVFLAIKPQQLEELLDTIKSYVNDDTVIISICAGITAEYIKSKTVETAKVVLAMPNTPLLLGEGATAVSKAEPVNDDEFDLVCRIFGSCGEYAVISKDKMKEIIAINGSSPAFIYLFAKGFIDYAGEVGINTETAKSLFAKSLIGSAKMITDSGYSIDELIKMVSSPGGTTLAGLDKLYSGELLDDVKNACEACTKRAYELSK